MIRETVKPYSDCCVKTCETFGLPPFGEAVQPRRRTILYTSCISEEERRALWASIVDINNKPWDFVHRFIDRRARKGKASVCWRRLDGKKIEEQEYFDLIKNSCITGLADVLAAQSRSVFADELDDYLAQRAVPHSGFILFGRTGTYKGNLRIIPCWFLSLSLLFEQLPLQEVSRWSIEDVDGHFLIHQEHSGGTDLFEVRVLTKSIYDWYSKSKDELFVDFLYRVAERDRTFIPFLKDCTDSLDFVQLMRHSA
jgi:hypothetical protein